MEQVKGPCPRLRTSMETMTWRPPLFRQRLTVVLLGSPAGSVRRGDAKQPLAGNRHNGNAPRRFSPHAAKVKPG
eukprot:12882202-Prorocentrum_lima.AAC.1